ncbi:FCD domain-containing protein [Aeromicrobium sp. UC242_57]|uniref:FCD domain-containing protein n=1 Tax=Aeromicrobium sp. UC242_57 TaxID=3374624 RepID=UPI00378C802F
MESEAVRLLRAEHGDTWPDQVLAPLEAAAGRLATATQAESAHAEFHRLVVASAGSTRITEAYAGLDAEMLLFLRQLRFHYDAAALCTEHTAYLREIQRTGEQAVRSHLDHSTTMLLAARNAVS